MLCPMHLYCWHISNNHVLGLQTTLATCSHRPLQLHTHLVTLACAGCDSTCLYQAALARAGCDSCGLHLLPCVLLVLAGALVSLVLEHMLLLLLAVCLLPVQLLRECVQLSPQVLHCGCADGQRVLTLCKHGLAVLQLLRQHCDVATGFIKQLQYAQDAANHCVSVLLSDASIRPEATPAATQHYALHL